MVYVKDTDTILWQNVLSNSNGNRTEWSTIQGVISGDYVPFDQSDYSLLVIGRVKSDSASKSYNSKIKS